MASRVVPGISLTMTRSLWVSALMMEDLPTLGRPTMARRRGGDCRLQIADCRLESPEVSFWRGFRRRGQEGHRGLHQGIDPFAVDGGDGKYLVEPQFGKLGHPGFSLGIIHLVDHQQHGASIGAQTFGHLAVQGYDALLHIDHQQDHVRRFHGQFHLLDGGLGDGIQGLLAAAQSDATGVDQGEGLSVPLGLGADPVPGDSGLVMHNGDAAPCEAVEKGGLADVGSADDGDDSRHGWQDAAETGLTEAQTGCAFGSGTRSRRWAT